MVLSRTAINRENNKYNIKHWHYSEMGVHTLMRNGVLFKQNIIMNILQEKNIL